MAPTLAPLLQSVEERNIGTRNGVHREVPVHRSQIGGLYHFLFLHGFDDFLGVYVKDKVDEHQKKVNSARIFQEINSFAHFYFLIKYGIKISHLRI